MPGVKDYGVVRSDGGVAVKRWPKLEPEPPSNSQFCVRKRIVIILHIFTALHTTRIMSLT